MKKKRMLTLLILLISALALTACSTQAPPAEPAIAPENDTEAGDTTPTEIEITHELGKATVKVNPERVLVFDYATLDSLDEMGVEVLGLPKSNIPTYLEKFNSDQYEDIGTLFEPDYEKIYELNPDVIFISGRQASVYEELEKIAPTVYLVIDTDDYIGSFSENLRTLGNIFNQSDFVEAEISQIESRIGSLKEAVAGKVTDSLIIMANDGSLSAYGEGSRFGVIHNEFAFPAVDKEIEIANHGQSVSFEYIVEKDPEYIFVIDRAATVGGSVTAMQTLDNDLIKMTQAYQNDKIIYLDSQIWYVATGGLKGTKIMIDEMQAAIQ
ncbi:siderophore ABC transporter substrate-binding protein [Alkaliphilus crotonatoxidans]